MEFGAIVPYQPNRGLQIAQRGVAPLSARISSQGNEVQADDYSRIWTGCSGEMTSVFSEYKTEFKQYGGLRFRLYPGTGGKPIVVILDRSAQNIVNNAIPQELLRKTNDLLLKMWGAFTGDALLEMEAEGDDVELENVPKLKAAQDDFIRELKEQKQASKSSNAKTKKELKKVNRRLSNLENLLQQKDAKLRKVQSQLRQQYDSANAVHRDLSQEVNRLKEQLAEAQDERARLEGRLKNNDAAISEFTNKIKDLESQVTDKQRELFEVREQHTKLEGELKETLCSTQNQLSKAKSQFEVLQNQKGQVERELDESTALVSTLTSQVNGLTDELTQTKATNRELQDRISRLNNTIDDLKSRLLSKEDDLSQVKNKLSELKEEHGRLNAENLELRKEIEEAKAENNSTMQQLNDLQLKFELADEERTSAISRANTIQSQLEEKIRALESENRTVVSESGDKDSKISELSEEISSLKIQLNDSNEQVKATELRLNEAREEFNQKLIEEQQAHQTAQNQLKSELEKAREEATSLLQQLQAASPYEALAKELQVQLDAALSRIAELEMENAALRAEIERLKKNVVSLSSSKSVQKVKALEEELGQTKVELQRLRIRSQIKTAIKNHPNDQEAATKEVVKRSPYLFADVSRLQSVIWTVMKTTGAARKKQLEHAVDLTIPLITGEKTGKAA